MREDFADQTQFAAQEPLLINSDAHMPEAASRLPKQIDPLVVSKAKKRKIIIFSVLAFLLFLFLLLVLIFLKNSGQKQLPSNSQTQTTTKSQPSSEFDAQIIQLQTELNAADPSVAKWPFPPVDLQASLFEIQKQR